MQTRLACAQETNIKYTRSKYRLSGQDFQNKAHLLRVISCQYVNLGCQNTLMGLDFILFVVVTIER